MHCKKAWFQSAAFAALVFCGGLVAEISFAQGLPHSPRLPGIDGHPWTNSLGMKFVPAGTVGVLFSVWDVRVKDYVVFRKETGVDSPKPNFVQTATDPQVNATWADAKAFCQWLTKKERAAGIVASTQTYRLPTDAEWSVAVGLGNEGTGTPNEKSDRIDEIFPWGTHWPPPSEAGNYDESLTRDGYAHTSPVGTFAANRYGLYDMGGNVWQWCEDAYDTGDDRRAIRGASWNFMGRCFLFSSYRSCGALRTRYDDVGFRVVLAVSP